MTIIPAIDIIDGKCVRLTRGDYSLKKVYNEDPLEVAKQFEAAGLRRLHLVDLDGAESGSVRNWKILEKLAVRTRLEIDFSGGIRTRSSLDIAFGSGAAYVAVGSMAVKDETELCRWIEHYGPDKFMVGADVRNEKIVISGWTEETSLTVFELVNKYSLRGISQFFCTDVQKDGLLAGPATSLYRKILKEHPSIHLIASGGVAAMQDIEELEQAGCSAVIIGKAIYENRIDLNELKRFIA